MIHRCAVGGWHSFTSFLFPLPISISVIWVAPLFYTPLPLPPAPMHTPNHSTKYGYKQVHGCA
jgi:hypothetical protein